MRLSKSIKLGVATAALLGVLTPAVMACGNAMLLPLIFKVYPEARTVFDATLDARNSKIISGGNWPGVKVMSLHQWRMKKMALTMMALKRRLNSAVQSNAPGGSNTSAHILFTNEMSWSEISPGISGVAITQGGYPSDAQAYIFTTRRALDAVLTGQVSYEEAERLKFIQYRFKDGDSSGAIDVFKRALTGEVSAVKHSMHMPRK